MTENDVISHWRKRSTESMHLAHRAHEDGSFALALFHCHLAVEKALKAFYMEQMRTDPPISHDLLQIAFQIDRDWTEEEKKVLSQLTQYAVAARYDDPPWAEREATKENSELWIAKSEKFLSTLPL